MKTRRIAIRRVAMAAIAIGAVVVGATNSGIGQASSMRATAPTLGTAASFAVLGGSTVTNTGPSVVTGNLGVSPGSAVTGFPPGIVVSGTIHAADAVAAQAQNDLTVAYNNLAAEPCTVDLTGQNLGGLTLTPGVYCFTSSAQLTGSLTLDGQGDPDSVFVFKIGSTLTTASGSSVLLINRAQSCNVYMQIGSSATLGTGTTFLGSILTLTSVTLTTGASVNGRALARNGAVTMDTNNVTVPTCALAPSPTATATNTPIPPISTSVVPTTKPLPSAVPTSTAVPTSISVSTATATATSTTVPSVTPSATGVPLAAGSAVSHFTIRRHRGSAYLHWYSAPAVAGFNVYAGAARLNRALVTSSTHWYQFSTRRAVNGLFIVAVPIQR